jgi:hypothetical protein
MDKKFSQEFADHWIASWNSHNLEAILSHYTHDVEMSSPIVSDKLGIKSGMLKGKKAISEYWAIGLKNNLGLHFELLSVFTGSNSVVIYYKGHKGYSSECFYFNDSGKVFRAAAHYQ